ncbi:MAG: tetratricopeptide repeat protein [Verrucomicrobiota bacterium]
MKAERHIEAAKGYLALGMPDEAMEEIKSLDFTYRYKPEVLELTVAVHMSQKRWMNGLVLARALCDRFPMSGKPFLLTAMCLDSLERTAEARDILLAAPVSLRNKAELHYNLSRLEAKLGNVSSAQRYLKRAVELNPDMKSKAGTDPHLTDLVLRLKSHEDGCAAKA